MVVLETLISDSSTWILWIPGFGFLVLDSWFVFPGLGFLGLDFLIWDSWFWIPGLTLIPGFGFLGLNS